MRDFDYSQMTDKPLTEMSDRMRNWYYRKLMDMANGDKLAGKEFIKGVSELEVLWAIDFNSNGDGLILENIKNLAEKHAQAVLEDHIKNQTPVSTTFAGKYEYTLPKPDKPIFIYNHNPVGRVEVNDSSPMPLSDEDIKSALRGAIRAIEDKHLCGKDYVGIGGKEPDKKDNYGRVYSDLEVNVDKGSSAKTEERKPYEFTKEEWGSQPTIGFTLPDWLKATKVEECSNKENAPRATPKNRYGIGQIAFVINQNEIFECEICDISTTEDGGISYTAYDDYGTDFLLTEEEVFTTVDELLSYLHKSAEEL